MRHDDEAVVSSPPIAERRHLLDGGFVVALLTLAVVVGYGVLNPPALRAKTMPRPDPDGVVIAARPSALETTREHGQLPADGGHAAREAAPTAVARSLESARIVPRGPSEAPSRPPELPPVVPTFEAPRTPWPRSSVDGRVIDGSRQPIAGASVVVDGREIRTGADGMFRVDGLKDAPLLVKMPGYQRVTVAPATGPLEVVLKPFAAKAAYLTYYGVNDRGIRGRVLDLVARTELNAVVIDVKGDRGWILYRTSIPMALEVGAQGPATIRDFDAMMADFKARGVYTIARIVTFKDNVLANARPDLAVIDTRTGKPWVDREQLAWVDPFREEVWAYNIAIAKEAAARGFDEVQFDYVRFPTDGKLAAARYARPVNKETRLPAIAAFLERARREIGPTGAFVGADIFGYTAFNENDTDIGQRIEELAPHLDFVCPMVYPSGYHVGIPSFRNPVANAYHVVKESVRLIRKRSAGHVVHVRPWLQDFRDYAFDRRVFGVAEIRDQIRGSDDGGGVGWMLWNPRNAYTGGALRQEDSVAAR